MKSTDARGNEMLKCLRYTTSFLCILLAWTLLPRPSYSIAMKEGCGQSCEAPWHCYLKTRFPVSHRYVETGSRPSIGGFDVLKESRVLKLRGGGGMRRGRRRKDWQTPKGRGRGYGEESSSSEEWVPEDSEDFSGTPTSFRTCIHYASMDLFVRVAFPFSG
jgi:hypothetical protein